ncbi:hypothetical protein EZS27_014586 [termite gut metagenome]|uniref:Uncharacterized protein n=1 Tax=termite gut metagenome TaxID=433724 RepID=A0A5J4RUR7_9ZZZZ
MEKKFMKYLLFGVFTFVLGIAFVGCGEDYDDSTLKTDISQVKTDLQTVKTDLSAAQTALRGEIQGVKQAATDQAISSSIAAVEKLLQGSGEESVKFEDLAPILGQLLALSDQLEGLSNALEGATRAKNALLTKADAETKTWAEVIVNYHYRIEALELQANVLGLAQKDDEGKYSFSDGLLKDIWAEIAALKGVAPGEGGEYNYAAIAEALVGIDDFIDAIIAKISNPDLLTLEAKINGLITGISYVDLTSARTPSDLKFNTTPALIDYVFGEGYDGAVTFAKAGIQEGISISPVYVRVTPAAAIIDQNSIKLINSKGSTDINDYVKVYKVEPYTGGVITKASTTGLYKITFTLKENYDEKKVGGLIKSGANTIAFAIAVENNKTETESRYVTTDFSTAISITNSTEATYSLNFKVNSTPIADIRNRYSDKELRWRNTVNPALNISPGNTSTTTSDTSDNRIDPTKKSLPVEIGEEFQVDATELGAGVYAYYVDFDLAGATAQELSKWNSADISGIKQVYPVGTKAPITINETTLAGAEVGFRVYAVNYNGTLVDPDGKAFYVSCGAKSIKGGELKFVYRVTTATTIDAAVAGAIGAVDISAPFEYPNGLNISNVANYVLEVKDLLSGTIVGDDTHSIAATDIKLRNSDGNATASWNEATQITLKAVVLKSLKDNGDARTGTLKFLDVSGHTLAVFDVSVIKELPNFPVTALEFTPEYNKGIISATTAPSFTYDLARLFVTTNPAYIATNSSLKVKLTHPTDVDKNRELASSATVIVNNTTGVTTSVNIYSNVTYAVAIGYDFGVNIFFENTGTVQWSDSYISSLRFSTSIDGAAYEFAANKSWAKGGDNELIYTKGTPAIAWKSGRASAVNLGDITMSINGISAPLAGGSNTGDLSSYYTSIFWHNTYKEGILRFVDKDGNYLEKAIFLSNTNIIDLNHGYSDGFGSIQQGPGVPSTTILTPANFTPVKAILYLRFTATAPTTANMLEKTITFEPKVVEPEV